MSAAVASGPVRQPGPDHPITVEPSARHVVVWLGGRVIADSRQSLRLQESTYPAVHYIPRGDVDMTLLERSAHTTYCPYKGTASYYSIRIGDTEATNAIWTYESPHAAVSAIKDHLAFYPDRVERIEVLD